MKRLLLALFVAPLFCHAQTLYWKGGDGTWSGTGNWRADSMDGAVTTWVPATTLTADAIIAGTAGNITINSGSAAAITANSVTILSSGYSIRSNSTTSATLNAPIMLGTDVRVDLGSPTATGDRTLNTQSIGGNSGSFLNFVGAPNSGNVVRVSLTQPDATISVPVVISVVPTSENLHRTAAGFVAAVAGNTHVNADITNDSGALTMLGGQESGYRLNVGGRVLGSAPLLVGTNPNGGGLGAVILTNQSTYTGDTHMGLRISTAGTTIGRLQLGTDNALPVTTNLIFGVAGNTTSGGDFDLRGFSQTVRSLRVQAEGAVGSITNGEAGTLGTLTVNGPDSTTFSLSIQDGLAQVQLIKTGSGTLTLSAVNSHTGGTMVGGGTLAISGSGTLGGGANTLTLAGGILDLGGTTQTVGRAVFAGGSVQNGSLAAATEFEVQTGVVGIGLQGDATLVKSGSASATLSATNTYTGNTTVSGGTLILLGQVASPTLVSGGTLRGNGRISSSATVAADGRLAFDLPTSPGSHAPLIVDQTLTFVTGASLELTGNNPEIGTTWTLVTAGSFAGPLPQLLLPDDWHGVLAIVGDELRFTLQPGGGTAAQVWREFHFGSADLTEASAADADPDGDGLTNLLEYALGLDPLESDGANLISSGLDAGRLTLTFPRIADASLTYHVEAANTLGATWTIIWTSTGAENTDGPVTVTDSVSLATQPVRFLRLRVETASW